MVKDTIEKVQPFPIMISLSEADKNLAYQFAAEQTTVDKRKQVFRNTLAVLAVNKFLEWMEIETELNAGESWNRVIRTFHDVADLVLPNLGILECRLVDHRATSIHLPPEVRENRIGCVVIEYSEQLNKAKLLGCYLTSEQENELPERLKLNNLSCLDALLDHLEWLEILRTRGGLINLRAFLVGLVEKDWQPDSESSPVNTAVVFRNTEELEATNSDTLESIDRLIAGLHCHDQECRRATVQKLGEIGSGNAAVIAALTELLTTDIHEEIHWQAAISLGKVSPGHPQAGVRLRKLIDLGNNQAVNLVMSCKPDAEQSMIVRVQVCPTSAEIHLPTGCKLAIVNEVGQIFGEEVEALAQDNYLQRHFHIDPGDRFGVKITLEQVSYVEHFVG